MEITFDNSYARLPDRFYSRQEPAKVPQPQIIRINWGLVGQLSLDKGWAESEEGLAVFSGNQVPDGAAPIAQAYAGHQFGGFSPRLGDGRAILLGELIDRDGARVDLQLKGSGRTAFSRGGDGKAALGPVLREYIVSEAMAALGVPTTRALAAVMTGELVLRQDGALPGAVLTRIASSHIRVGTFEYFFARNDIEAIRLLADHVIARHFPQAAGSGSPYLTLLESVVQGQADLIAQWMSLGFIHGVMNTDNTAISGETIDYGPCAFMDAFDPQSVFSSIDTGGRYSWGNQPDIGLWNLTRFAETLLPLLDDDVDRSKRIAELALGRFPERFWGEYASRFRKKFGLPADAPAEHFKSGLELLARQEVDFTRFFHRLTLVAGGGDIEILRQMFSDQSAFDIWFGNWQEGVASGGSTGEMRRANPVLIPRNHRIEQAITSANGGDFAPFHRLVEALQDPYREVPQYAGLEQPPRPEEIVCATFCGT